MIKYNYPLKKYNTFGIDIHARKFVRLDNEQQANELFKEGKFFSDNCLILGGGSNILFTGDYDGTVIQALFRDVKILEISTDSAIITADAGLEWDWLVEWAVKNGLGGLENLSGIPGHTGAAPIQNIGAYGAEVSEMINAVHAISLENGDRRVFSAEECRFGYRDSIFKNEMKGKYLITRVEFRLSRDHHNMKLSYGNLEQEIKVRGQPTLAAVRDAVIKIRNDKLPDPSLTGNAGSFFKNPVLETDQYTKLKKKFSDMPSWELGNGLYKVPAAWLIEKAGWKGRQVGRAAVHHRQALVLVNLGGAKGSDILKLSRMIMDSVEEMSGIRLSREVNII
ncbi:MAG: UDP-N-acetylmuramate dehydrogenase [Bacteroidales bacterium]